MRFDWIVDAFKVETIGNPKAPLTEDDVSDWLGAAARRPKYKPQAKVDLGRILHLQNPWRWRRLKSDFRWAQKVLEKKGYDPEEIRWLLQR